jgi:subtilase family serine protease
MRRARGLVLALSFLATAVFAQDALDTNGASTQLSTQPGTQQATQKAALSSPSRPGGWRSVPGSAFKAAGAQFHGRAGADESVAIVVALALKKDLLESHIVAQLTPGSPVYQRWLSSEESTALFGPTGEEAQAVADYLTRSGFTNVAIAANRLLVSADGTVALAERAFNTQVGVFSRGSDSGLANTADIQVPDDLQQIEDVLGLNTVSKARTRFVPIASGEPALAPAVSGMRLDDTESGCLPGVVGKTARNPYPGGPFFAEEYANAYNTGGAKANNTEAALIGWGSMTNPQADLGYMMSARNIPTVPTAIVNTGGASADDSARVEWSLDSQAIVGITGGVKKLTFYTSGSDGATYSALLKTINRVVQDNTAKVINMSWGSDNCDGGSTYFDNAFMLGIAQGQTFVAASGDNGAYACHDEGVSLPNGAWGDQSNPGVGAPANSPYVIAIGGTRLNANSGLAYGSESAWKYSGGGVSEVLKPSWQSSVSGAYRRVPDLAFDAEAGMAVYYANGSIRYVGGTSLSAPLFTGVWAILQSAKGNNLGFAAPAIYGKVTALSQNGALHDVTTGNNGYPATGGYDNATGWGSLDVAKTMSAFSTPVPGFAFVKAVSRKTHEAVGVFDNPIDPNGSVTPGAAITVEPRSGGANGAFDLVFQFDGPVSSATAAVTSGSATVSSVTRSGNEAIVHLTNVPNATRLKITVNAAGANGNATASANVGFLYGDVDKNHDVNSTDTTGVRIRAFQPLTAANYVYDVDGSGAIQASDTTAVRIRAFNSLP